MVCGQFLRYTRIEALPQLINVLRGEMSIIDRDARSPSFLD
jgi:lipopolysaccharide/colanic/teichoic acid biosynthesis glycosyltransferase